MARLRGGGGDGFAAERIGDPFLGDRPVGDRASSPLVMTSVPPFPETLPAGPVNPSSRKVPVLRLSSTGTAIETTVGSKDF